MTQQIKFDPHARDKDPRPTTAHEPRAAQTAGRGSATKAVADRILFEHFKVFFLSWRSASGP
jgi:hypothetical protein